MQIPVSRMTPASPRPLCTTPSCRSHAHNGARSSSASPRCEPGGLTLLASEPFTTTTWVLLSTLCAMSAIFFCALKLSSTSCWALASGTHWLLDVAPMMLWTKSEVAARVKITQARRRVKITRVAGAWRAGGGDR